MRLTRDLEVDVMSRQYTERSIYFGLAAELCIQVSHVVS